MAERRERDALAKLDALEAVAKAKLAEKRENDLLLIKKAEE